MENSRAFMLEVSHELPQIVHIIIHKLIRGKFMGIHVRKKIILIIIISVRRNHRISVRKITFIINFLIFV